MTAPERRLAAIMFTDIVGYTALMARDEEAGRRARERHRALVRPLVDAYHGESIEARGDESLSLFPRALDAVNCALALQEQLEGDPEKLRLHIGIHQSDIELCQGEVIGDGVNIASGICGHSDGSTPFISDEVQHAVQNQSNLSFESLGEHEFKNVPRPVPVFRVIGTAQSPRPLSPPQRLGIRWPALWLTTAVVVLGLIGVGVGLRYQLTEPPPIRSIAVLPLENLPGDPEQEYFADGMTEVLISDLARVRITAQLIEASSDEHLWSDSYDRDLRDILALHSEVARAIAGEIELQLSGPEEPAEAARPVDPGALEAYLKGRHRWNKRTGGDLRKSIEYFESAVALDPDWALAYSGLAEAYVLLATYDPSVRPRDSMPRARAGAERALELDDELAPAHTALAMVRRRYDWDWEGAEAEFQRALELGPSYETAHHWYALDRINMKKRDALEHIQRARELDPLSMIIGADMGMILFVAGEYDRSIETLRETLELDPGFANALWLLPRVYAAKGMHKEAVEIAERIARTDPESPIVMAVLAGAYARAGRRDDALRILEEVRGSVIDPLMVADLYAALGEADAAFEWPEKAYERRSPWLPRIWVYPGFDPIRSDPRFDDLLRRIGFPEN